MTSSSPTTLLRSIAIATILTATGATSNAQSTVQNIMVGNAKVTMLQSYNGTNKLPKPATAIVYDFNVPGDVITIDNSAAARLSAHGPRARLQGNTGNELDPASVAASVQSEFSQTLVNELNKTSIPATSGGLSAASDLPVNTLTVHGDFIAVNQGNKTQRVMIGLGRGASDVQAHVTVSQVTGSAPIVLAEFDLNSESGKKPGAAATMGASAATTAAASAASNQANNKDTVEGDTSRMAKAVAREIENVMAAQGWIPATSQPQAQSASTSPKQ